MEISYNFIIKSFFFIPITIAAISCAPSNSSQSEEATEEAVEEASAVEESVEAAPIEVNYDQLENLPCKEQDEILLSNFYQLTMADANRVDQEPRYYGMFLENTYSFFDRIRNCLGEEVTSPDQVDRFFDLGLDEYRNELRTDLMPLVEEEMMVVGVPFVTFATGHMIPDPTDTQHNGFTYQKIYNYYREEFRNLYLAYVLLKHYSSFEYEMRLYANVATTLYQTSEKEIRRTENFDEFIDFRNNRYRDVSWSQIESLDPSGSLPQYASFWMRRGLDGSSDALVKLQERVLELYDGKWKSDLDEELIYLPKMSFTEDRNITFIESGSFGKDNPEFTSKMVVADGGFVISPDSNNAKSYETNEFRSHTVIGYSKENHGVVISRSAEDEFSFYLDLKTGNETELGHFLTDYSLSPDSRHLVVSYNHLEGSGIIVFEFENGIPIKKFQSGYLYSPANTRWVSDDEFLIPMEMDGSVSVKISDQSI